MEIVLIVIDELVTVSLWDIDSDPFYPWEALRQLNRRQKLRIEDIYRQLLLRRIWLEHGLEFCPTANRPEVTGITKGRMRRSWCWDSKEGHHPTNDIVTFWLAEDEFTVSREENHDGPDDENFGPSPGETWNHYVNSFPPGGLSVTRDASYVVLLDVASAPRPDYVHALHMEMKAEIPASRLPDVQDNDADKDSIKISATQLIGGIMRVWRKGIREAEEQNVWRNQWYISLERLQMVYDGIHEDDPKYIDWVYSDEDSDEDGFGYFFSEDDDEVVSEDDDEV